MTEIESRFCSTISTKKIHNSRAVVELFSGVFNFLVTMGQDSFREKGSNACTCQV